jgi:hypothetical protein
MIVDMGGIDWYMSRVFSWCVLDGWLGDGLDDWSGDVFLDNWSWSDVLLNDWNGNLDWSWGWVVDGWLLVVDSWLLVVDSWLLIVDSWLLVVDSWLLVLVLDWLSWVVWDWWDDLSDSWLGDDFSDWLGNDFSDWLGNDFVSFDWFTTNLSDKSMVVISSVWDNATVSI